MFNEMSAKLNTDWALTTVTPRYPGEDGGTRVGLALLGLNPTTRLETENSRKLIIPVFSLITFSLGTIRQKNPVYGAEMYQASIRYKELSSYL